MKTSGSLLQYKKDDVHDNKMDSESFKFKPKMTERTPANGNTRDVEIFALLKYLSNFWRSPEMSLISYKISLL